MLKNFRITAILEGISYLLLFLVGMPLKYLLAHTTTNMIIGYIHGFLFILYVVLAILVCYHRQWSLKRFSLLFIAALLPFGTFYAEKKYLREA
ncbi:DUF3817 domain-containing protein [Sinomicrobium weinanense]|uniref:DUF3817 domain-containing protein n=1 Tax=Sinomicrobium weinanense TaxID=2842200 RepID=A0A926JP74_9FLAO|nr:DUF3817 domain-containing protein [Sinomicrobium weinanense]MBC9794824.1 DUF3817 domain-containing protein [Sinomicrobium weinanense]MBU3125083.1 DUF3817 domain-containing protein [Sinomicrobium weinanense]